MTGDFSVRTFRRGRWTMVSRFTTEKEAREHIVFNGNPDRIYAVFEKGWQKSIWPIPGGQREKNRGD